MPAVLKPARTGVSVSLGSPRQVSTGSAHPVGAGRRLSERPKQEALTRRAQLVSRDSFTSRSTPSVRVQRHFSPDDDDTARVSLMGRSSSRQVVQQRTPRSALHATAASSGSQLRARLLPRSAQGSQSQGARRLMQVKPEREEEEEACEEEPEKEQSATPQRRSAAVLVSRARKQDQSHASHTEAQAVSSPRSAVSSPRSAVHGEAQQGRFAVRVIRAHGDNLRGDNLRSDLRSDSLRSDSLRSTFPGRRGANDHPRENDAVRAEGRRAVEHGHRAVGRRVLSRETAHKEETPRQVRAREREIGSPAPRALLAGRGTRRHVEHAAALPRRSMLQDEVLETASATSRAASVREASARGHAAVLASRRADEARREKERQQQLDDFQQLSDELDLKVEELQKESDDLNAQLAEQEDAESELLRDKANLRTDMEQMSSRDDELKKEMEDFEQQMQEMKKREEKLNSEALAVKQKMEEMTQREEEQANRELSLKAQKDDLQKQSQELKKRHDSIRSQQDDVHRKSEALKPKQASASAAVTRPQESDGDLGPALRRRAAKEEPEDAEPPAKRPRREASAVQQTSSAAATAGRSAASAPAKLALTGGSSAGSAGRAAAASASGSAASAPASARKRAAEASMEQAPAAEMEPEVEEEEPEEEEWFEGEEEECFEGEEEEWLEGEEEEYFEGGEEEFWEGGEEEFFEGEEEECVEDAEEEDAFAEESEKEEKSIRTKQEIEEAVEKHEKRDSNDHWEMRSRSRSRERTRGESGYAAAPEAEQDTVPPQSDMDEEERRRKDHIERRRAEVRAMSSVGHTPLAAERGGEQNLASSQRDNLNRKQRRPEAADADAAAGSKSRHTAASFNHPSASDGRRDRHEPASGGRERRSAVDRERPDREEPVARVRRPASPLEPPRRARTGGNMSQGGGLMRRPRWTGTAHMDRGH